MKALRTATFATLQHCATFDYIDESLGLGAQMQKWKSNEKNLLQCDYDNTQWSCNLKFDVEGKMGNVQCSMWNF